MILVTGATGHVGYKLLEKLADNGTPATAMVRIEAEALDLPGDTQHLVASLDAPPLAETLRRFDRVFLLSPASDVQAEVEIAFVDALVNAGHRPHVVKVAMDGFQEPDCEVRFMRNHRQIAMHLEHTDLPVTFLAANVYMEDLLSAADTVREQGAVLAPAGDGRVGFVAASDVAAVAAHVLSHGGHEDRVYPITGPEALSHADVADRISKVFARTVVYENIPPEQARELMLDGGLREWYADGMLELFEWIRNGGCDTVTDEVRKATGEDARPIGDWLLEVRAAFLSRPSDLPPQRY